MLVGPTYHESSRKIQTAVAPRMSKLQAKAWLLSWLNSTHSLAHLVTNRFFSFKKRTWVTASLCPFSRYRPLSLMTSHTMTSVSWNRQSVSKGLAFVSTKHLPLLQDGKDYFRAHFLTLNLSVRDDIKWYFLAKDTFWPINAPLPQPESLFILLTSQASSQLY